MSVKHYDLKDFYPHAASAITEAQVAGELVLVERTLFIIASDMMQGELNASHISHTDDGGAVFPFRHEGRTFELRLTLID